MMQLGAGQEFIVQLVIKVQIFLITALLFCYFWDGCLSLPSSCQIGLFHFY